MRDGLHWRGAAQGQPEDGTACAGGASKPKVAFWTVMMALCMGAMTLWGALCLIGKGRGRHG